MKVEKVLTSKAIYYYSITGNTKSLIENLEDYKEWDIHDLNDMKPNEVDFKDYETILLGTLTLGRGLPPVYFKKLFPQLSELENRQIGLFGSGQSHYGDDYYCGALDVLENLLQQKNRITFKYKFESYPTPLVVNEFNKIVKEMFI